MRKRFLFNATVLLNLCFYMTVVAAEDSPEGVIFFGKDNAALPSGGEEIEAIAKVIKASPAEARFGIEGHASDLGPDSVNMTFSERRAEWVRDQLVEKYGVKKARLEVIAKGEGSPMEKVESGDAADEKRRKRSKNRRVEVKWFQEPKKLLALSELPSQKTKGRGVPEKGKNMKGDKKTEPGRSLVAAVNETAVNLFREEAKVSPKDNLLLSPHSIGQALMMTRLGAAGETAKEMSQVLNLAEMSDEALVEEVEALRSLLEGAKGGKATFSSANGLALLGDKGSALPEYSKLLTEKFGAELLPNADVISVNGWVSDQTKGKIEQIVEELDPESRLVILNALYFKADWEEQFDKALTEPGKFTGADGKEVEVPMMSDKRKVPLVVQDDYRAVGLPYQGGKFVWVAVLPSEENAEKFLETGLSSKEWADLVKQGSSPGRREVRVSMPRMELEAKVNLGATFQALGMTNAFSQKADFSKMSEEELMISEIQHKVKLTVNESGSEAAAATAVVMKSRGLAIPPKPFVLDRPFLFAIAEAETGTLIVLGRVSKL